VFLSRAVHAQGDDETVLGEHDPIEQDRDQVERLERRLLPGPHLGGRLRHEPAAHTALAGAAAADPRGERLKAAPIAARRHPEQHLFHHTAVERVRLRQGRKRRQGHFPVPGADPRAPNLDLAAAEHDRARRRAGAPGRPSLLMLVAPAADRSPILFEHGFQHFQARADHELRQLGARIDQQIDQRQVPDLGILGLYNGGDCARLLHGGSFRCGLCRGLPTSRLTRPAEEPPTQFSTATGTSPRLGRRFL
jgi:hypothetical protein